MSDSAFARGNGKQAGTTLVETLDRARIAADAPAALLAFQRDGSPPLAMATGLADQSARRGASTSDTFSVGSLTKPLVAVVVLKLCAEGTLKLSATLDTFGIEIPNAGDIPLKFLLNHTSGVFNFGEDLYGKPLPLLRAFALYDWSFEDVRQIIAAHEPEFAPGRHVKYSNSNYILLGQVVERATGETLGRHLRHRVFSPLGMEKTFYAADEENCPLPTLRGYAQTAWGGDDVTELETYRLFGPGGGIVSTAGDMLRCIEALDGGELLSGEWQRLLVDDVRWDTSGTTGMSCGFQHFRRDWGVFRGHGGNTHGYTAGMWRFVEDGFSLAFGINRAYVKERAVLQPVVDFLRHSG